MSSLHHPKLVSEIDLCAWLSQAAPSEVLEYHRGFLIVDIDARMSGLPISDRREVAQVARRAMWAADNRLLHLVQRRIGPDRFSYLAIARPRLKKPSLSSLLLAEAA
jgi:hypothetical protein